MNPKQVQIDNHSINYFDDGTGEPILFVHGFPLDHTSWKHQLDSFSSSHRVIAPDLPGFGASKLSAPDSIQGYADFLAAFLDEIKVSERVTFCGLSMGGYIGWEFWKRTPGRLKNIIACDTRAADDSEQVVRARRVAASSVLKTGSDPVADAMTEKLFWESTPHQTKKPIHQVIANTDSQSIADGQLAMSVREDATPWLAHIEIPTLFVVGEHDEITPPTEMEANSRLVKNSKFLEIKNAGHLAPLENPVDFNAGLASFLSDI